MLLHNCIAVPIVDVLIFFDENEKNPDKPLCINLASFGMNTCRSMQMIWDKLEKNHSSNQNQAFEGLKTCIMSAHINLELLRYT